MGRHAIAFVSYNPFNDQRIDPISSKNLLPEDELPGHIHDAVYRAKKLIGDIDLNQLKQIAEKVDKYVCGGCSYGIIEHKKRERDYSPSNESDILLAFLKNAQHDEPLESWPKLFGVLTLCLAGEITNTLWPSPEYKKLVASELSFIASIKSEAGIETETDHRPFVVDLVFEAVKSVGIGEGFFHGLFEKEYKQKQKLSASKTPKTKQMVYEEFQWWVENEMEHPAVYSSTESGFNDGFVRYLEKISAKQNSIKNRTDMSEESKDLEIYKNASIRGIQNLHEMLLEEIGESTHRRAKKYLEEQYIDKPYPFPRKRSKKKKN